MKTISFKPVNGPLITNCTVSWTRNTVPVRTGVRAHLDPLDPSLYGADGEFTEYDGIFPPGVDLQTQDRLTVAFDGQTTTPKASTRVYLARNIRVAGTLIRAVYATVVDQAQP
jgi:hypothetical protein